MKFILFLFLTSFSTLFATSQATFPKNIQSMVLVKQSIIPGKDVVLPKETPLFLQETVSMYNWINKGEGVKRRAKIPHLKR